LLQLLGDEGIFFEEILIDASYEHENAPTRKPRTGLLTHFFNRADVDWQNSFVIGDRLTDVELAYHLGIKAVFIGNQPADNLFPDTLVLSETDWGKIADFLVERARGGKAALTRNTKETQISCDINLYGSGILQGGTGFQFFDHLLMQFVFHSKINLTVECFADVHIDEHHGIEDFAVVFGECFRQALGDKKGISRYGFFNLVMDETLAQVALDFSSRPYLTWDVPFSREKIGDTATEMFEHFFHSFCTHAGISAHVKTQGRNEHHIAEATFKAFAKSIFAALLPFGNEVQSTKGLF
jgi:imidazoleglycerol-phosphate dehydratase/histidinol-phosphatase